MGSSSFRLFGKNVDVFSLVCGAVALFVLMVVPVVSSPLVKAVTSVRDKVSDMIGTKK